MTFSHIRYNPSLHIEKQLVHSYYLEDEPGSTYFNFIILQDGRHAIGCRKIDNERFQLILPRRLADYQTPATDLDGLNAQVWHINKIMNSSIKS